METPTKTTASEITVRDTGFAAAANVSGWPMRLENRGGVVYFVFRGDPEKFRILENDYFEGRLKLPARDLLNGLRTVKDRLYSLKTAR